MAATTTEVTPPAGLVRLDIDGPVAWIRLNRPQAMNALSVALLDDLDLALDRAEGDAAVRVVVLTGTANVFCAGADLKGLLHDDGTFEPDRLLGFIRRASRTIERIPALHKPVIAAVNGIAVAGGLELILTCDVVIAARSARIGDAHANYGVLPAAGGAARLARVVGPVAAKYLAFTGDSLQGETLVALGLVNEIVDDGDLESRVAEVAHLIAGKSPAVLAHLKRLIDDGLDQPLADALRLEHEALTVHVHSPDIVEGLTAFRERRTPHYVT